MGARRREGLLLRGYGSGGANLATRGVIACRVI